MTAKENKPTKLFSTNLIKHKAAIFGLIMQYNPSDIHFFFKSLACTGYNDTLIILYSNIDKDTKKYIISFSKFFEIIMIPMQLTQDMQGNIIYINHATLIHIYRDNKLFKRISGEIFHKVEILQLSFECGDFRFEVAHYLYNNNFFDDYDLLFITDIGDVLFQSDIRMFNYTDGVYVVEEAGITIKNSHYWLEMYNADYRPFENKIELCVGTLVLVGKKSFSFLNDLHNEIQDHLDLIFQRPNFQGTLNFLIYNNSYHYPEDYVRFLTTSHGIINSIAKLNGHMENFNKKRHFNRVNNLYDIYYHDRNFILYNHNLQKLAVIHHTKYLPITQNLTFRGVLNICRNEFPTIFKMVMNIQAANYILF